MFNTSDLNTIVSNVLMALIGTLSLILVIKILLYRRNFKKSLSQIICNNLLDNIKIQNRGFNEKRLLYRNKSFLKMKNDGNNPCEYDSEIKINISLFYDEGINLYY